MVQIEPFLDRTHRGPRGLGPALAVPPLAKLEWVILPLYRDDQPRWIWMMKETIGKIGSYFNSQRMMRRYASEAYLR